MACTRVDLGNGRTAIVCGPRNRTHRCKECGSQAVKQCDFPLRGKSAGRTCDVYLCARCAVVVGKDRDYCPPHARLAEARP